jgi:hypothetical protein
MKSILGFGFAALVLFSGLSMNYQPAFASWVAADAQSQIASQILADNMHRMQ